MKQLSEEYETILENVQKTYKVLEARKSVIPELKKTAQEAQSKFKGAQKALQTQDKVVELNRELAWAYVKTVFVTDPFKRSVLASATRLNVNVVNQVLLCFQRVCADQQALAIGQLDRVSVMLCRDNNAYAYA